MPEIRCTICAHQRSPEIVAAYIRLRSLRFTAALFRVGYKSLERHLSDCVPRMFSESEEEKFYEALEDYGNYTRMVFGRRYNAPRLDMRIPRPKSIITKEVKFSWSRRSWETKNKPNETGEAAKKAK